jgi:hypothetical protein
MARRWVAKLSVSTNGWMGSDPRVRPAGAGDEQHYPNLGQFHRQDLGPLLCQLLSKIRPCPELFVTPKCTVDKT